MLAAQLVALILGDAEAQAQRVSNTPDPTVVSRPVTSGHLTATGSAVAADGPHGTDLRIKIAGADDTPGDDLLVRVHRILQPENGADLGDGGPARVAAPWRRPDGTQAHGIWATARSYPAGAAG